MAKIKTIIVLFVSLFIIAPCSANLTNEYVEDNVPIVIIRPTSQSGVDRSSSISASINGHNLTIDVIDDIGPVTIKITDDSEVTLDIDYRETPTGYLYFIPSTGHYVIVITLSNDDEYEGEFDVTD